MHECLLCMLAGDAFRPLADDSAMRQAVFPGGGSASAPNPAAHRAASAASYAPNALRPAQVSRERAEKSVQMWVTSMHSRLIVKQSLLCSQSLNGRCRGVNGMHANMTSRAMI